MQTTPQYAYRVVEVVEVIDGDTYWLRLDIGFRQTLLLDLRLSAWDTPELRKGSSYERAMGAEARDFAGCWLRVMARHFTLWVQTEKDPDNFGRWLGRLWAENDAGFVDEMGEFLARHQLATPWPTRWREIYDVKAG